MKIAFLIFILVGITFLGCSDNFDNTLVSTPITTEKLNSSTLSNTEPFTPEELYTSRLINGDTGGVLLIDTTYINSEGRQINVYARLRILPGSFQGIIEIEMAPNDEDLSIQLFPEMAFDNIVMLDIVFTGIDLEGFGYTTNGPVDFVYFDGNGDIVPIENKNSKVNVHHNQISVRAAILYHFSRYGWVR